MERGERQRLRPDGPPPVVGGTTPDGSSRSSAVLPPPTSPTFRSPPPPRASAGRGGTSAAASHERSDRSASETFRENERFLATPSPSSLPRDQRTPGAVPGRPRQRSAASSAFGFKIPPSSAPGGGRGRKKKRRNGGSGGRRGGKGGVAGVGLFGKLAVAFEYLFLSGGRTSASGKRGKNAQSRKVVFPEPTGGAGGMKQGGGTWSVTLAVGAWYILGVISIGTSKVLLTDPVGGFGGLVVGEGGVMGAEMAHHHHHHHHHRYGRHNDSPWGRAGFGVTPLLLTLQQLLLGCALLRALLGAQGKLRPLPSSGGSGSGESKGGPHMDLFLAALFFGLGFLATNYSFQSSAAPFVETVKAAEPITSAGVAVLWGIETLGLAEVASLAAVVAGVFLSTVGHRGAISADAAIQLDGAEPLPVSSLGESVRSCMVVMVANLCFSFRGLHQKLFRATPQGSSALVDDANLQYRMQQLGVLVFIVPALVIDVPGAVNRVWMLWEEIGLVHSGVLVRYGALSLLNGFAFAGYNLSSTFVLTRISVVHHAALNCIRRIFAIVVTSIAFDIPISIVGAVGIFVSFCGFMSFTHYKSKRLKQPRPLSSLLPMSAV